jgi:hypothetical protein
MAHAIVDGLGGQLALLLVLESVLWMDAATGWYWVLLRAPVLAQGLARWLADATRDDSEHL